MEVPAPAAGVLREILLHTDDDAVPGAVLGRIAPLVEMADEEPFARASRGAAQSSVMPAKAGILRLRARRSLRLDPSPLG